MAIGIDYYITMVSKNTELVNLKGSSLTFSAHGWWGKEKKIVAAKISVRPRKNTAEGGCGENSAVFLQKIEASPAALLIQSRTQQKSFLFLLEEKIRRAQNQKCRENFFAGLRVVASGGGAERQFRSKKFRAKFRISHQMGFGKSVRLSVGGFLFYTINKENASEFGKT